MARILFPVVAGVLAAAPAVAQQTIGLDETIQLPSYVTGATDHATIAVNQYGDALVSWHGKRSDGRRQVECQLITYVGPNTWQSSSGNHVRLGMPGQGYFPLESCTKPDVVNLDDGSFVITWTRSNPNDPAVARLEAVRINPRDVGGDLLPTPLLQRPAFGEGYLVDDTVTRGDAGVMPDLAAIGGLECAVVYAHETSYSTNAQGDEYREYDLRCARMDWAADPVDPQFVDGPHLLVSGVPMDNPYHRPYFGGLVLPDVVADDFGNLVVANEQYWVDGHGGVSGSNDGRITVRRFGAFGTPNALQQMDETVLQPGPLRLQRRPSLSTSYHDGRNSVLIGWVDNEFTFLFEDNVRFRQIDYPTGGGPVSHKRMYWDHLNGKDEAFPSVMQADGHRLCVATRTYANFRALLVSSQEVRRMWRIPSPVDWPWRPASAVLEGTPPSGVGFQQYAFFCYEGGTTGNSAHYRIYFVVHQL